MHVHEHSHQNTHPMRVPTAATVLANEYFHAGALCWDEDEDEDLPLDVDVDVDGGVGVDDSVDVLACFDVLSAGVDAANVDADADADAGAGDAGDVLVLHRMG